MRPDDRLVSPTQRGWRYGAVATVAILIVGGSWLVATGMTGQPPATTAAGTPAGRDTQPDVSMLGRFAVSADGAAAAAAAAVATLGQPDVLFDDDRLDRVAADLFVAGEVRPQVAEIAIARQGFARSGWDDAPAARRSYFSTPLAIRLTDWTDTTTGPDGAAATVEVWSITVITIGDVGGAVYTTSTVGLVATDGRWRVGGMDSVEGPTPAVAGDPSVPGAYRLWLREVVPTVPVPHDTVEAAR